jgi:hypothetical protein
MPALGFKPRFATPIRDGRKTHTIRARMPAGFTIGHWAPLYTGMRTKQISLIGSGLMNRAFAVRLDFDAGLIDSTKTYWKSARELDAFAASDGFADWRDMEDFWAVNHKGIRQFTGVLLGWGTLVREHRIGAKP